MRGQGESPAGSCRYVGYKRCVAGVERMRMFGCVEEAWLKEFEYSVEYSAGGCAD